MARAWYHVLDLEEYQAGMWRKVFGDEASGLMLSRSLEFLRDQDAFRSGMQRVLKEWPCSCRFNFTNPSLNKPVWLAHAAACLVRGIPEKYMRQAYCMLPSADQARADADAIEIAAEYESA